MTRRQTCIRRCGLDIAVTVLGTNVALAQSTFPTGLVLPPNWPNLAQWDPNIPSPGESLPSRFNWEDLFPAQPVRNQLMCGSCWAMATAAAVEYQILIQDRASVDISEQWLVSCNANGYSCNGGAHGFDYFTPGAPGLDQCGEDGAVLEADYLYTGTDSDCTCPNSHNYWIDGWAFIGPTPGFLAPPINMKHAIFHHGPIVVSIRAGYSAFFGYADGVLNTCSPAPTDHMVTIVGWDDSLGSLGAWRVRNSWGTGWGENGYAWIPYGCSQIGLAASYAQYPVGRGVWVDLAYLGDEEGSYWFPFNTIDEGMARVDNGGMVSLKAGSIENGLTLTLLMRFMSFGGSFVIGQ